MSIVAVPQVPMDDKLGSSRVRGRREPKFFNLMEIDMKRGKL